MLKLCQREHITSMIPAPALALSRETWKASRALYRLTRNEDEWSPFFGTKEAVAMGLRSRRIFAIGILLAAGARADNADRPDVHVGDRWSWQHTNGLANERDYTTIEDVIDVSGTEIKTRWRIKGKPTSSIAAFTPEWNPVDVVTSRYEPWLREFAFPLQVGKKWEASADKMLFSNGKHGKFTIKGEVVGLEKVTEPAGAFDAYKISLHIDAVSSDEDANIGNTVETIWYVPSVKRYVRFENTFSRDGRVRSKDIYDLLEYSLR